jgi:hypothetical protein
MVYAGDVCPLRTPFCGILPVRRLFLPEQLPFSNYSNPAVFLSLNTRW